jgi:hypothetical protein
LFHADRWMEGRTDRQTDVTKLIVAFRNFANAPYNEALGFRQNILTRDTTARVLQTFEVLKINKLHSVLSGL